MYTDRQLGSLFTDVRDVITAPFQATSDITQAIFKGQSITQAAEASLLHPVGRIATRAVPAIPFISQIPIVGPALAATLTLNELRRKKREEAHTQAEMDQLQKDIDAIEAQTKATGNSFDQLPPTPGQKAGAASASAPKKLPVGLIAGTVGAVALVALMKGR